MRARRHMLVHLLLAAQAARVAERRALRCRPRLRGGPRSDGGASQLGASWDGVPRVCMVDGIAWEGTHQGWQNVAAFPKPEGLR